MVESRRGFSLSSCLHQILGGGLSLVQVVLTSRGAIQSAQFSQHWVEAFKCADHRRKNLGKPDSPATLPVWGASKLVAVVTAPVVW